MPHTDKPSKGPLSDLLITQSQFQRVPNFDYAQIGMPMSAGNSSKCDQFAFHMEQDAKGDGTDLILHPHSLPKNPKVKKLGANEAYAKQYELYKAKQAEFYASMHETQARHLKQSSITPLY